MNKVVLNKALFFGSGYSTCMSMQADLGDDFCSISCYINGRDYDGLKWSHFLRTLMNDNLRNCYDEE